MKAAGCTVRGIPGPDSGIRLPWCLQCNKPVESLGCENDAEPVFDGPAFVGYRHIRTWLIIECHGETYRIADDRPSPPMPIRIDAVSMMIDVQRGKAGR